jgi:hypothetical protein
MDGAVTFDRTCPVTVKDFDTRIFVENTATTLMMTLSAILLYLSSSAPDVLSWSSLAAYAHARLQIVDTLLSSLSNQAACRRPLPHQLATPSHHVYSLTRAKLLPRSAAVPCTLLRASHQTITWVPSCRVLQHTHAMLNPLDAISLTSAIVQFVDFGSKLLLEGYGAYKDASGASEEHADITEATTYLQELAVHLGASSAGVANSKYDTALQSLTTDCEALSKELLHLLEELQVKGEGVQRTWDAVRKTIKGYSKKGKIERFERRLERIQRNMNGYLVGAIQ